MFPPGPLAHPPADDRARELWLQHVAGYILMRDVRRPGLEAFDVDAAVYGLMQVAEGVTGSLHNDCWEVRVRVVVELADRNTDEVHQRLDLYEGDGACTGLHGWIDGDYGTYPITQPS